MTDQKNGQEYLSFVLEKLQARLAEISQSLLDGQKEIENMHDYYWQNYTEMDQYGYEDYDNQQALLHQVNANQEQLLLRSRFRKMLDSPFFGRVDFRYDGDDEPEIFYIGIGNFAERPGELPLIYDWRSPVSGLFYDFDRGPASYLAPGGEMTGEICSKWQYKIRDGKMIYGFESDVKIDDDILKAELGSNGEVQLKNIIRTIQKEQNAIIRNTKDRILVIQGAAGSGKTSVALFLEPFLKPLSAQEEKSCLDAYQRGDTKARDILVERNLRLVAHVVKKYQGLPDDLDDLISIGTIGLIKAVMTYDSKKGNRLAAYAARCIDNELLMYLRSKKKTAREISLYEPIGTDKEGNEIHLLDIVEGGGEDIAEQYNRKEDAVRLYCYLDSELKEQEKQVLLLRYGLGGKAEYTQKQVAARLGISRSYVSRIEKNAIEKLRLRFAAS